jgi:hypothetical protein
MSSSEQPKHDTRTSKAKDIVRGRLGPGCPGDGPARTRDANPQKPDFARHDPLSNESLDSGVEKVERTAMFDIKVTRRTKTSVCHSTCEMAIARKQFKEKLPLRPRPPIKSLEHD